MTEPMWIIQPHSDGEWWTWIVYFDGAPKVWDSGRWALPSPSVGKWGCTYTRWGARRELRGAIRGASRPVPPPAPVDTRPSEQGVGLP